jgi:hypothetical protein
VLTRFGIRLLGICGLLQVGAAVPARGEPEPAPATPAQAELRGAPKWVSMGCAAYFERKDVICGVAAVEGVADLGLARVVAESRARTEIARSLQARVKKMLGEVAGAKHPAPAADEPLKMVTDSTITGARPVAYWFSKRGTVYALVVLDVDAVKKDGAGRAAISDETRTAFVRRAEEGFRRLGPLTEGDGTPAERRAAPAAPTQPDAPEWVTKGALDPFGVVGVGETELQALANALGQYAASLSAATTSSLSDDPKTRTVSDSGRDLAELRIGRLRVSVMVRSNASSTAPAPGANKKIQNAQTVDAAVELVLDDKKLEIKTLARSAGGSAPEKRQASVEMKSSRPGFKDLLDALTEAGFEVKHHRDGSNVWIGLAKKS